VTHLFESIPPGKDEPQASQSLFPLKQMAAAAAFCFLHSLHRIYQWEGCVKNKKAARSDAFV
jgi:hypothetical protein